MQNEPTESVIISISPEELEARMLRAAKRALDDAGLSLEDKEDRAEAREDFRFLRRLRKAVDGVAAKIGYAVIAVVTGGFLLALWTGIRTHILKQ
jgi:hypothetical protein